MLSAWTSAKASFNETYNPRERDKRGFFKSSVASIAGLTRALGWIIMSSTSRWDSLR